MVVKDDPELVRLIDEYANELFTMQMSKRRSKCWECSTMRGVKVNTTKHVRGGREAERWVLGSAICFLRRGL